MYTKHFSLLVILAFLLHACGTASQKSSSNPGIVTGAEQTGLYLPFLQDKNVGMFVNQTAIINDKSLVDSLLTQGIRIAAIFGPEHGFRGNASAGTVVNDSVDVQTGIPIISLYGSKDKPTSQELENIDIMVFDIQDVGVRFYTYINSLRTMMEACAENNIPLLVLDRPNPNGFYVDGPVLDMSLKSGIGQFPIPILHGLTIGEFAQMVNGEGWLADSLQCDLHIIKMRNYTHDMPYTLPVAPSPNLNSQQSILLYPTLCLFEGTIISQGRGTHFPFTVLGNPDLKGKYEFSFTPVSIPGMSETPLHQDQACFGLDLRQYDANKFRQTKRINLQWLKEMYQVYPHKEKFFDYTQSRQMGNFDKLAGSTLLKQQIIDNVSDQEIFQSWEPALSQYKEMREKYLMYE